MDPIFGVCRNMTSLALAWIKLLHYSYDVMTDIALYRQEISVSTGSFYSFGGASGSEMMRDGGVGLLPTLERSQKYDCEISNWLVACNTDSSVLQTCHLHVSCTLVSRNHPILHRVSRLQKTSNVWAGTSNA